MAQLIKIKKGLDIHLKGKAWEEIRPIVASSLYSVFPDDYSGFYSKVAVKVGDKVQAGSPVLYDKNRPEIKVVSPVSGEVQAVNRGEKRKILDIVIQADEKQEYLDFGKKEVKSLTSESIKIALADAGLLALIKQRPYDIVPTTEDTPRDIFVSGFYSAPLAPNFDLIVKGQEKDFQTGLDALNMITSGKIYLGISPETKSEALTQAKDVMITVFDGSHPAGNVGVQINHIRPINKGEIVWTVDPADVITIGRFFNQGIVDLTRIVALTGSEVKEEALAYYKMLPGVSLDNFFKNKVNSDVHLRYISGDVLTGACISDKLSLRARNSQLTVIPEGDENNEFVGWAVPGCNKFSVSRTYPAFLTNLIKKKEYRIDARIQGGRRAMIMSNEWDKVFPMDILPEFLIRAIIAMDIDKMENLGIYEVAPEDFALCEFVDTSKMELQKIVRQGLDWLHKEMM